MSTPRELAPIVHVHRSALSVNVNSEAECSVLTSAALSCVSTTTSGEPIVPDED